MSNFASFAIICRIEVGAAYKDVCHGVPGVMDSDQQQAERCSSYDE
jgi:hypothetical protein